jgi:TrmH family RNA methyltransferase
VRVVIDSPANPRIRAAAALRERRERDATGLTLVDGARESLRAIEAGVAVDTAFVSSAPLGQTADGRSVRAALAARGIDAVEVGPRAMARLGFGDRAEGIVLVVRSPATDLAALERALESMLAARASARGGIGGAGEPLIVVTEGLEKPGNLGAILRSADGAGADAVIAAGGTDLFNPNVIRASAGIVFGMPLAAAPPEAVVPWLRERGIRIVAARVDAERLHTDANLTGPLALAVGSEAEGLSGAWAGPDIESVRLPMRGVADSLNVSVAAAVLLYEARRQRDRST